MKMLTPLLLFTLWVTPAAAQDLRDLCPTRPGLGTPSCIVDKGHVLAEMGAADWTKDDDGDSRTDTVLTGDLLMRYGLDSRSEVQLGWTAFGHNRERNKATGAFTRAHGTGDLSLTYKRSLMNPDGSGFSAALQPSVTFPTGGSAIGAGDWSVAVIVPVSVDVAKGLSLQLSPEIDAAVDMDGKGRHAAYGGVAGLGIDLSDAVSAALELSTFRDNDPMGHSSEVLIAGALAWQPAEAWQLDLGGAFGLNADSPDARLYCGIARRF
ncbi:transporter [Sphingobium sp. H39-3-25]|uniref:transporter n=1 Tax=Sphingobium arseniciresistens TaxID=3030834 RepID=UPI0023B911EB|nr:transporter [Sphingobium arseniciresistens]